MPTEDSGLEVVNKMLIKENVTMLPMCSHWDDYYQKQTKQKTTHANENIEQLEPLCMVGGIVNGKQYGHSSKNKNRELSNNPAISPLVYIQKNSKQDLKGIFVHPCSLQHYSQKPRGGSNPNVH